MSLERRIFIKGILATGVLIELSGLSACGRNESYILPSDCSPFSEDEYLTIVELVRVIFPDDGNGPSGLEINAPEHILWTMHDPGYYDYGKEMLLSRLQKMIQYAEEKYNSKFLEFNEDQKSKFVLLISRKTDWGEALIKHVMSLIFEALLLDPFYKVNPDKSGWEWLDYRGLIPGPDEEVNYYKHIKAQGDEV